MTEHNSSTVESIILLLISRVIRKFGLINVNKSIREYPMFSC